jgi:rSAM/selenodomain-associated transferase 1
MIPRRALLIFAKVPRPGAVKTRLQSAVSPEQAAELHKACISDTLRLARGVARCGVLVCSAGSTAYFEKRRNGKMRVFPQRGANLGERLENAFRKMFRMGFREVVVIGTDSPWMGTECLRNAFATLSRNDLVLGPTVDGGYFLLGLSKFVPELFRGIPWSTENVCEQTLRAAQRAELSTKLLAKEFDLDRPEDLLRAGRMLKKNPLRSPALAKAIHRIMAARREQRAT